MNVADILEKAAEIIDECGHCKDTLVNSHGALCAVGAIGRASANYPDEAVEYLQDFLCRQSGDRYSLVVPWNDRPERTHEEVTSTMRAAAALWRAQAGLECVGDLPSLDAVGSDSQPSYQ
jgi:hypothetical protein